MSSSQPPDDPAESRTGATRSRVEAWAEARRDDLAYYGRELGAALRGLPEDLREAWSERRKRRERNARLSRRERSIPTEPLASVDLAAQPEDEIDLDEADLLIREGRRPVSAADTIVAQPDDDAGAIVGKLDTATDVDVLLVVPRNARGLRNEMAWPRIAAHVRQRGMQLHVLAARRGVRNAARAAGLPAARTMRGLRPARALRVPLGDRELSIGTPAIGPLLRVGALFVAIALAAGAACYYIPSADIVVAPPSQSLVRSAEVRLNPVTETDIASGVIAGTSLRQTVVSIVSTTTTGTTTVGSVPATVELVFTNDGASDIELPVGTPVDDEGGYTFTTDVAITVPSGSSEIVTATAQRPGTAGNLEPDSLRLLIGFPPTLTVTNPDAAVGGEDEEVAAIAQEDVDRAGTIAEEVLRRTGERELLAAAGNGTVFLDTMSVAIIDSQLLTPLGSPGDAVLVEYTAAVSALYLDEDAARAAGQQLLQSELPDGMALLPDTTAVEIGDDARVEGSVVVLQLTATGQAAPVPDAAALRGDLTGVSPDDAASRLRERLALDTDPIVTVSPTWLPAWRMPWRASRITLEFVSEEELQARINGEDTVDGENGGDAESTAEPTADSTADSTAEPTTESAE